MTDDELMKCLERFPGGEPVTLYHTDVTGNLVKAIQDKGAMIDLKPGEFWLTTEIESRSGFKGGKGLDTIARFQVDRRFVQMMAELSLSQREAGQAEAGLKFILKMAGKDVSIAVPRVNFEGGGRGQKIPEGHVNIGLRMTKESPEMSRLFQLSIKKLDIVRLDPSRAPGDRVVLVAKVNVPKNNGSAKGAGRAAPAEEPFVPEILPGTGRNIRIPGRSQERAQVAHGLTLMGLQAVMAAANYFNEKEQRKKVDAAVKEVEDEINWHRAVFPTEGVLLRYAYLLRGAKTAAPVFVTPVQPLPDFQFLEVLYGMTRDEAMLHSLPEVRMAGPNDDYQYREAWIPPLVAPSVSEIRTPWKKVALGTFIEGQPRLQQVEFADTWGFDDEHEMDLQLPAEMIPQFILLRPPAVIKWIASAWWVDTVKPPVVTVPAARGGDVLAVDLDPTLGSIFSRVTAVAVFPADDATDALFATTPPTIDQGNRLSQYLNFSKVRWVRPENLAVLASLTEKGDVNKPDSAGDSKRQVVEAPKEPETPEKPAKPPTAPLPDPRTLEAKDTWGQTEVRGGKTVYIVKPNDTLWSIAKDVYGDPSKSQKLFDANKKIITDPNLKWVFPGQVLELPDVAPKPSPPPPPPPPLKPGVPVA